MLTAIYDDPIGYSIRDGDGKTEALTHSGPVKRYRLKCYSIENALLTDECLTTFEQASWATFCDEAGVWLANNPGRRGAPEISALIQSEDRWRHKKIKDLRLTICDILGSKKPWEVHVGQALGLLFLEPNTIQRGATSLVEYMGIELLTALGYEDHSNQDKHVGETGSPTRMRSGQAMLRGASVRQQ
jgi:hypothetical protein